MDKHMRSKMKAPVLLALFTGLLATFACGQGNARLKRPAAEPFQGDDALKEIVVNGVTRSYLLHIPKNAHGTEKLPLVIAFHGGGGNAGNMARMSGFDEKADRENFLVVYPNGTGRAGGTRLTFNAVGCCAYAMRNNVDEAAFISALIDTLIKENGIDKDRVYLTGFSNGAMVTSYLAARLTEKIAAAAPVSGSIFVDPPKPSGKVAILLIHGTADTAVPYDGGMSGRALIVPNQSEPYRSVKDEALYWAKNSGCGTAADKTTKGNLTTETYKGCSPGGEVEVISIEGGEHAWPGGKKGREEADEPSRDLNATDAIWEFFKTHHK